MRPGRSDDKGRRVTARRTKGDDGPRPIVSFGTPSGNSSSLVVASTWPHALHLSQPACRSSSSACTEPLRLRRVNPRPILATDERKPIASDVNTGKAETASRPSPRKREEVPRPPSTAETTRAGCNSARALTRFTRRKRNGSVQADGLERQAGCERCNA